MTLKGSAFAALALVMSAPPGQATDLVDAGNPERLVEIIRDLGYRAVLSVDDLGDPMITSGVSGTDTAILFFGCQEHVRCKWLLFKVGYDLSSGTSAQRINEWNEKSLFGKAYLDAEQDPWLEMAVNLDGGVTRANFEDTFDWWDTAVSEFETHIEY